MSNPSKDLEISLEDLQAIARIIGIKDYESMFKDELSNIIFPFSIKKSKKRRKK